MQGRNLIILGIAVVVGLFAVFLANSYFSGVQEREARKAEELQMARIVVASQDIAFGQPLAETTVRLVAWPANSVPAGAFTSVQEAIGGGRVALSCRSWRAGAPAASSPRAIWAGDRRASA